MHLGKELEDELENFEQFCMQRIVIVAVVTVMNINTHVIKL